MSTASGLAIAMPSGLDDGTIISELVGIQQQSVTTVQNEVSADQTKISDFSQIKSLLDAVSSDASALSSASSFDVFTPSSTNSSAVTVSGAAGASVGQYNVNVYQLASSEQMISKDSAIASNTKSWQARGSASATSVSMGQRLP